jgi:hypothetical protein
MGMENADLENMDMEHHEGARRQVDKQALPSNIRRFCPIEAREPSVLDDSFLGR